MYVLLTILGISALIFIHEFGHFICARMAGVRVHIFSLGFGQRLWGFRRGDTDYRISLLPIGGYVMVAGDDPAADRRRLQADDLCAKGFFARFWFYSGGVIMNLLFAILVFPIVFHQGILFGTTDVSVPKGSPAWEAGLQDGDKVLTVAGKEMYSFANMRVEIAIANEAKGVPITYQRGEEVRSALVFPRYDETYGINSAGLEQSYTRGPYEIEVDAEGPAAAASLETGMILLEIAGRPIRDVQDYREATQELLRADPRPPSLPLKIRDASGAEREVKVQPKVGKAQRRLVGFGLLAGTVLGLRPHPGIEKLGLQRGDRVLKVQGQRFVGGELDFGDDPAEVTIDVERAGELRTLRAPIPAADRPALAAAIALGTDTSDLRLLPQDGRPARAAGMQDGDQLLAIAGQPMRNFAQVSEAIQGHVQAAGNAEPAPLTLSLRRGSEVVEITARPEFPEQIDLGFSIQADARKYLFQADGFGNSVQAGWVASIDLVKQLYVTLKRMFTGQVSTRNLGGPITITRVTYRFAQEGWARWLFFLAMLSINLAVINLLPIPVLDGGHLMFLLIEKAKGSPVNARVHGYSQIIGVAFVLMLLIYVTYNDILRLFQ